MIKGRTVEVGYACRSVFLGIGAIAALALLSLHSFGANLAPVQSSASKQLPTLTTAKQAHGLSSAEAARAYPTHLRGVVTYFDPDSGNGFAALFVCDPTGCVWVNLPANTIASLPAGSLVEVTGVSGNGQFAPIVDNPQVRVVGRSRLPDTAVRASRSGLFSGKFDAQWVEADGIIHSYSEAGHTVTLYLHMVDGEIKVTMVQEPGANYSSLVDARVKVHANAAPLFRTNVIPVLKSIKITMTGTHLMAPGLSAIEVLEPAPQDPFQQPVVTMGSLMSWNQVSLIRHRVHLRGTVTLFWPGSHLCLRDASSTFCAGTRERTPLDVGEMVDVAGFTGIGSDARVLTEAVYRRAGRGEPVAAVPATAADIDFGEHDSELISIDGQLVGFDEVSADTTLVLSTGKVFFTATLPQGLLGAERERWLIGSRLRLTGICSAHANALSRGGDEGIAQDGGAKAKLFRIQLRSVKDVVVLQKASWWTALHLLVVLVLALAVTLLVIAWGCVLYRRVQAQTNQIRESEERFRQLALHDALTGLAARPLLADRLKNAVESISRRTTGLALLILDVDRFKQVNDTFGHQAGDEVLRVTAVRLLATVRKSDTVARYGGDEFVVLLTDLGEPSIAKRIAANIVANLAVPIPFADGEIPVSVSVGLCTVFATEIDAETMLKHADAALYHAKSHGRNRLQVFAPDMETSHQVDGSHEGQGDACLPTIC